MLLIPRVIALGVLASFIAGCATTVEEAGYQVISKAGQFELRDYPPQIVAETKVDATLEDAGGKAFRRLFNYITGENRSQQEIAMTTPVTQKTASQEIAMTSPVGQQKTAGGWLVSFMMPADYTMATLPVPTNPEVHLRETPARQIASVEYSGRWTEELYLENLQALEEWIVEQDLVVLGEPVWARYNPPFTPWFLRRNEILFPVAIER